MTIVLPLRTRRVRRQRAPTTAPSPTADRVPRVARMLALAHHWKGLIRSGVVKDQAALAALVGVSRARVTQVMDLLHLAPDLQEQVLFLVDHGPHRGSIRHSVLVRVAAEPRWAEQRRLWSNLAK